MKIPINVPVIGNEEIKAVQSVLEDGLLTSSSNEGGRNVRDFEKLLSSFVESKYAIAVNSGTAALQAALYALDIKKGDEVLLPSFTFVATANAVVSVGATPVFVDILANYTIDPKDAQRKITKKTKAIIPVHLYGHMVYIDEVLEIAKRHNLEVIEDSCQALGTTYKGKHSGTFSRLGCFSMYPSKVVTAGEGGAVVTNDKNLFDKLRQIRNHGMLHGYDTRILGLNLRLPEISAAIAKVQMRKIKKFLKQRRKNAKVLTECLSDLPIILPSEREGERVNWYLYTVATEIRARMMKKLNSGGICAYPYYSLPIHQTPFYDRSEKLEITEWAASHVLSLPIHPLVSKISLNQISKKIHELF